MATKELRRVARVAERRDKIDGDLEEAILEAHESGASVREIAPHAGLSSSRTHELLQRARARLENDDGNAALAAAASLSVACAVLTQIVGSGGCPMLGC